MDNDNKIGMPVRTVSSFLDETDITSHKKAPYNLENEFAKTKANKSHLAWFILGITIVVFTASALGIGWFINERSKRITVDIQGLEDINLKDILDVSKNLNTSIDDAKRRRANIVSERDGKIYSSSRNFIQERMIVETSDLDSVTKKTQLSAISMREKSNLNNLNFVYKQKINSIDIEIADLQLKADSYDSRMIQKANEQEMVLNNQQQLSDLKLSQTINNYEKQLSQLRYDNRSQIRKLEDARDRLIREINKKHEKEIYTLKNQHASEIASLKNEHKTELANLQDQHEREIEKISNEYQEAIKRVESVSSFYQDRSSQLVSAIAFLVRENRENGYLLSRSESGEYLIYMDPLLKVKAGDIAYVFRNEQLYVGKIKFSKISDISTAEVIELCDSSVPPQPFDKILLKILE